jgi:GTPase
MDLMVDLPGDKAKVKFRFIKHPEYIKSGQRMVFREGRTKAVSYPPIQVTSISH